MTGGIGLIVNPRSHRVARQGAQLTAVAAALPGAPLVVLDDFGALEGAVAGMARAGVERIFVEGGDGTLLAVMSACLAPRAGFGTLPAIGVLAGGSTNLAAKILGFRAGSGAVLMQRLTALASGGQAAEVRQRALVATSAALRGPAVGFLLSTGALARAMRLVQTEFHGPGRRGSPAIAAAIARFLAAPTRYRDGDGAPVLRPSHLGLSLPGADLAGPHAFALMTTLPRLSLGLHPFWGAGPGGIALTHAGWPIPRFRRSLLRLLLSPAGSGVPFASHRADRLTLIHEDPVMMDGEVLPRAADGRLHVTLSPELRFLR